MKGMVQIAVAGIVAADPVGAVPMTIMFESIVHGGSGGDEVFFASYPSFDNMILNDVCESYGSNINVSPLLDTTGLMAVVDFGGGSSPPPAVPLPPALALALAGLAGMGSHAQHRRH
jgi:hypothetical protein